jgi:hypothetical protein
MELEIIMLNEIKPKLNIACFRLYVDSRPEMMMIMELEYKMGMSGGISGRWRGKEGNSSG